MTTLCVLVDAMPASGHAFAWALVGDDGRVTSTGRAPPAALPAANATVAILDAPLAHVTTLALPPIASAKLGDAVRYALDDRLAAAADSMRIVHGAQGPAGRVRAVAASTRLVEAVAASLPRVSRIVALPSVAPLPPAGEWHWLRDGSGFVMRSDGSALPTGIGAAPPELGMSLREARRAGDPPTRLVVRDTHGAVATPRAPAIEGFAVTGGAAWSWDAEGAARAASDATLPDLLATKAEGGPAGREADFRWWRRAARVVLLAVGVFVLGSLATAGWLAFERHRDEQRAIALARDAGVEAADFEGAMAAIARRDTEARHARGELAPGDALPLLARAAPALAAAPTGRFRRATYASGAWTLDFAPLDDTAREALVTRLAGAGLVALSAASQDGTRLRVQP